MSKPIGIGSQGWRRADRRVYGARDGGGPLLRGQWERVWVVGETGRSWICSTVQGVKPDDQRRTFKIPKSGENTAVWFEGRDVEFQIWASEHRYRIAEAVNRASAEQLYKIAALLGYASMPSDPQPDGRPWLIERSEGGWGKEPVRLFDIDGREVDHSGRPVNTEVRP